MRWVMALADSRSWRSKYVSKGWLCGENLAAICRMTDSSDAPDQRIWMGLLSLLCVGVQFRLMGRLTWFNVDFVSVHLPLPELAAEIAWDQWIAVFCYSGGFWLVLKWLWVLAVFNWLHLHARDREAAFDIRRMLWVLAPAWAAFIALNGFMFVWYGIPNLAEVSQKLSIYFRGPEGLMLPEVSYVPFLIPLLALSALGFRKSFRQSRWWRLNVLIGVPAIFLAVLAEHHVNFARNREAALDNRRMFWLLGLARPPKNRSGC